VRQSVRPEPHWARPGSVVKPWSEPPPGCPAAFISRPVIRAVRVRAKEMSRPRRNVLPGPNCDELRIARAGHPWKVRFSHIRARPSDDHVADERSLTMYWPGGRP